MVPVAFSLVLASISPGGGGVWNNEMEFNYNDASSRIIQVCLVLFKYMGLIHKIRERPSGDLVATRVTSLTGVYYLSS